MGEIKTLYYERKGFKLSRRYFTELKEEEIPKVKDSIQEANEEDEEFELYEINDKKGEVLCRSKHGSVRTFFIDSIRVHPNELKRKKKQLQKERKALIKQRKLEREARRKEKLLLREGKQREKERKQKQKRRKEQHKGKRGRVAKHKKKLERLKRLK